MEWRLFTAEEKGAHLTKRKENKSRKRKTMMPSFPVEKGGGGGGKLQGSLHLFSGGGDGCIAPNKKKASGRKRPFVSYPSRKRRERTLPW